MTDPILTQLIRLRDLYALYLTRLEASNKHPLFKRAEMKQIREAIQELDAQIATREELGIANQQKGD